MDSDISETVWGGGDGEGGRYSNSLHTPVPCTVLHEKFQISEGVFLVSSEVKSPCLPSVQFGREVFLVNPELKSLRFPWKVPILMEMGSGGVFLMSSEPKSPSLPWDVQIQGDWGGGVFLVSSELKSSMRSSNLGRGSSLFKNRVFCGILLAFGSHSN